MKKILLIITLVLLIFQMVVLAVDIDIGSPAIGRDHAQPVWYCTYVNKNNPANDSGTITQVEIWAQSHLVDSKVATFFVVSGNNLSTRDTQAIGTVTAGSKQTFNVNLDVEAGDYIGITCGSAGDIEDDYEGYGGVWQSPPGDYIPCTNVAFTLLAGDAISLYGTGATVEEEEEANATFFGTNF